MDDKKDFLPVMSHTRFLEHTSTHSYDIPVLTDGSKSDAGTLNPTVMTAWWRSPCVTSWSSALVLLIYNTATSTGVAVEIAVSVISLLGPACLSPGHDVFRYLGEAALLPKL
ncbi:hypothetical protein E2C01_051291 [Portunus trituberculatus]|uniref:Uncharacterized protein n=1 Tax=Portunus trituberculatus TaxID=210409 RepID=A0A5B7GIP5_PORTR|nr:hypothetical protein [Portunus trituberculatus]